jgi:hypothetical protein
LRKALVGYVTPVDATADIAMTIAEQLCRLGFHVDLRPVSRIRSPRHYRTVILGGASDSDRWHPEALNYLADCVVDGQHSVWPFHTDFRPAPARVDSGPVESWRRPIVPEPVRQLATRLGDGLVPIFRVDRDCDEDIRRWASHIGEELTLRRFLHRTEAPYEASLLSEAGR